MKRVEPREDVDKFLNTMKEILKQSENNLIIIKESKTDDKTHKFMIEYNLKRKNISEEIMKLDTCNYSYTDDDYNLAFKGDVWIFGQMLYIEDNRQYIELYIKVKLNRGVICMSFHPKEYDSNYPYNP